MKNTPAIYRITKWFIGIFLICFASLHIGMAQSNKAQNWANTAKAHASSGNFVKAVEYYQKALDNDQRNPDYKYGLALAFYRQAKYPLTIKLVEELFTESSPRVEYFRLLGNSYDLHGNYEKGISVIKNGLKQYPKEGKLFLDLGVMEMLRGNERAALDFWEAGIEAEPSFPSNYFFAAKTFAKSNEKIWALQYGEIFMNLERGTERSTEMSQILYELYESAINETWNNNVTLNLVRNEQNSFQAANDRVFGMLKKYGMLNFSGGNDIKTGENKVKGIAQVRKHFMETWLQGFSLAYQNVLYSYHKEIFDLGFLEAYNFWLFSKSNPDDFMKWMNINSSRYNQFIDWFLGNPLKVDIVDNSFRRKYLSSYQKGQF